MATVYDWYKMYAHCAINELREKGHIENELDWDINRGKFTLRIKRNATETPTVFLITFRRKDETIVIIRTEDHSQRTFKMDLNSGRRNREEFYDYLLRYVTEAQL